MIYAAFILGLAGSLHCLGMCGPLALALPGGNRRWGPLLLSRLLYNFGRIITYTIIGFAMGVLGRFVMFAGFQQILSLVLGVVLLLGLLFYRNAGFLQRLVGSVQKRVAGLLKVEHTAVLLPIGILNGLLPCGLVYAAAAASVLEGGILGGGLFMFIFGLGTVPMMLAVSLTPRVFGVHRMPWAQKALPAALLITGSLLLLRGMGLDIPYLSPAFQDMSACCFELNVE
jgi:sulfite exporter TauE/SafE